jgi:hypothetical protein
MQITRNRTGLAHPSDKIYATTLYETIGEEKKTPAHLPNHPGGQAYAPQPKSTCIDST